jgi:hypothetical protein
MRRPSRITPSKRTVAGSIPAGGARSDLNAADEWPRTAEAILVSTPFASIAVATAWRTSCKRNPVGNPARAPCRSGRTRATRTPDRRSAPVVSASARAAIPPGRPRGRAGRVATRCEEGRRHPRLSDACDAISNDSVVPYFVYAGTKNAVRAISEGLSEEAGGQLGGDDHLARLHRHDFAAAAADSGISAELLAQRDRIAIAPEAIARAIAFAMEPARRRRRQRDRHSPNSSGLGDEPCRLTCTSESRGTGGRTRLR